jgi:carbonic anhydrase/acetyltransferase-like protein (isoleucine patch superfamily)
VPVLSYRGVTPNIAEDVFIAPTAVVVGDVTIEAGANIWFGAVIRGDTAPIRIGSRSNIQDNCTLHADENTPCTIGADCSLGHNAVVHGATIQDGVLIGMHATVLNNAVVESGALVAAGALVPEGQRIPAGQLAVGIPAKVVRPVSGEERTRMADGIQHYLAYVEEYDAALWEDADDADDEDIEEDSEDL